MLAQGGRQQTPAEDGDALSRLDEYFSLCGKTQENPSQAHLTLPFLICPLPHGSPLHWVGTLPKTRWFPLISFLSRHLDLPPAIRAFMKSFRLPFTKVDLWIMHKNVLDFPEN